MRAEDVTLFVGYVLPELHSLVRDRSALVKLQFARQLPDLAAIALHFVQRAELRELQSSGSESADSADDRAALQKAIEMIVSDLLADTDSDVKHALLESRSTFPTDPDAGAGGGGDTVEEQHPSGISYLCQFFGPQKTEDVLMTHMITFLNEKVSVLRCTLKHAGFGFLLPRKHGGCAPRSSILLLELAWLSARAAMIFSIRS